MNHISHLLLSDKDKEHAKSRACRSHIPGAGLSSLPAGALDSQIVYNAQGVPIFETRFFDTADGPFMGDEDDYLVSTWRMNAQQKAKIVNALNYWAQVLTPTAGQQPFIINVGTYDEENAAGYSALVSETAPFSLTKLQAAFAGQNPGTLDFGSHAQFTMGLLDFDTIDYQPSQLPRPSTVDLASVALHELAHGLGIMNQTEERGTGDRPDDAPPDFVSTYMPYYAETFGTWTEHLRDDNGNPAQRGQVILCTGCDNAYDPNGFDVRLDQGYFTGDHVNEVLAGAMRGVPVKILGGGWLGRLGLHESL
ncbi:Uncharacterised protein [Atlantibacter hermannii]|nr:Uncharacterised protein [Atlantibacter hermannii]